MANKASFELPPNVDIPNDFKFDFELTGIYSVDSETLEDLLHAYLKNMDESVKNGVVSNDDFEAKKEIIRAAYNKKNEELNVFFEAEQKYNISDSITRKPELLGDSDILLSVRHLKQFFKLGKLKIKAVSNISFDVYKGECFGIVGESGCGKTTTGRTIIKLYKPTSGSVYYRGYRIVAGSRWNQKEIKWTKYRTKEALVQLKVDKEQEIMDIDRDGSVYSEQIAVINKKYEDKKAELIAHKNYVVKEQRAKIKRISYDQTHTPKKLLNEIQMIFQDPVDSLDPRMTVEDIIQEGLHIQRQRNKAENHARVVGMLGKVGLLEEHASRYPHEFSGGQRQRIGIARALIMNPSLLICDEPISALDVSIRAQVINLLNDLRSEMNLTLIFIAHDLSVVKYFCDRIAVMYFGSIVELATSDELFKHPLHPYTRSLLSAIPKPNPRTERNRIRMVYHPEECHDYKTDKPSMREVCPGHLVFCNDKEFKEYSEIVKNKND